MSLFKSRAAAPAAQASAGGSQPTGNQRRGQTGEDAAVLYLQARGYKVVVRNWRPAKEASSVLRGEIDCIAWHGKTLVFVEVKARTSNQQGTPQEAVTPAKQRQLSRLANAYISYQRLPDTPCRFDVVEVWLAAGDEAPRLALHQNAFDYCEGSRRGARIF